MVIAFRQVAFMQHTLIWDARDIFLPWRYFVSECLRNGVFPAWDPYQQCGYPFFADPQSGVWYPVALLVALPARYSVYLFNAEFIFTIAAGGMGMFRLIKTFDLSEEAALLGAFCFSACGFYISNAEHLSWAISATWIVWLFWAYRKLLQSGRIGYAMLGALFQFLLLSGGYPAFLIVSSYILLVLFAGAAIANRGRFITLVKGNVIFAVAFVLLAWPCLYSLSGSAHFMTRGVGVTLAKANMSPFSPRSMLSLLVPFASLKNDVFYLTDISMRNAYIGIVGLAFMLSSVLLPGKKWRWGVLVISVFCLVVSFGAYVPLRGWLYSYVPMMNLFRFPSLFRLFFIIGFVVLAAGAFHELTTTGRQYIARFRWVVLGLLAIVVGLLGYELLQHGLAGNYSLFFTDINEFIHNAAMHHLVIAQAAIQVLFLLVLLLLVQRRGGAYFTARNLLLLCALDMVVATQLNMYGTVTDKEHCATIHAAMRKAPAGFPVPDIHAPVNARNDDRMREQMKPLTANLNNFCKNIATDSYSPFILSQFDSLSESRIKDSVWANPFMYLSYEVLPLRQGVVLPSKTAAVMSVQDMSALGNYPMQHTAGDGVQVRSFVPGKVAATVTLGSAALLVLQQVNYPGWQVQIDGRQVPHYTSAYCNITVPVPAGTHEVTFGFLPRNLHLIAGIYIATMLGFILSLFLFRKQLF